MKLQILLHARSLALVALAASGAGALAVTSSEARSVPALFSPALTVTFKAKGPTNARRRVNMCHKRKNVRTVRRGALVKYKGTVTPPFAKHFDVEVKLERCVRATGRFVRVAKFHIQGKRRTGEFKALRRAPKLVGRITLYSAVAVVNGVKSNKRYIAVVR